MTRRRRLVVAALVVATFATAAAVLVAVTRGPADPPTPPTAFWYPVKPGPDVLTYAADGPSGRPVAVVARMSSGAQMLCEAPTPQSRWWNDLLFTMNMFDMIDEPTRKPAWTARYAWDGNDGPFRPGATLRYVLVEDSVVR